MAPQENTASRDSTMDVSTGDISELGTGDEELIRKARRRRNSSSLKVLQQQDHLSGTVPEEDEVTVKKKQRRGSAATSSTDYSASGGMRGAAENADSKWKHVIAITLVTLWVLVTLGAWLLLSSNKTSTGTNAEPNDLQAKFTLAAAQIEDQVQSRSHRLVETLQMESRRITGLAMATNVGWPYYVPTPALDSFERHLQHVRQEATLQSLVLAPLVDATSSQQDNWNRFVQFHLGRRNQTAMPIHNYYHDGEGGEAMPTPYYDNHSMYAPVWLMSPPPPDSSIINYDVLSTNETQRLFRAMLNTNGQSVISEVLDFAPNISQHDNQASYPHSLIFQPIYNEDMQYYNENDNDNNLPGNETAGNPPQPVAILMGVLYWHSYLADILPNTTQGILMAEFHNDCGQSIRYQIEGDNVTFLSQTTTTTNLQNQNSNNAMKDDQKPHSESLQFQVPFMAPPTSPEAQQQYATGSCRYTLYVLPTGDFLSEATHDGTKGSNKAGLYTAITAILFIIAIAIILMSVRRMQRGQSEALSFAADANYIIAAIFPGMMSDQAIKPPPSRLSGATKGKGRDNNSDKDAFPHLLQKKDDNSSVQLSLMGLEEMDASGKSGATGGGSKRKGKKNRLVKTKRKGASSWEDSAFGSRPIADLFPEATVLYCDICGFTAWSSSREPHHVFELLESVYHTFDELARKRGVFKVDTVGDTYCCITGVPIPKKDHAVTMAEFARDILVAFDVVTSTLEVQLGPETGDLTMRAGIHSGPVTAGVLRGERSRFQLFGGTVSRAAKIESVGEPGRIVISKETADLLAADGKSSWFMHRDTTLNARGRDVHTFWLDPRRAEDQQASLHFNSKDAHPSLRRATKRIQKMDENCLIKTKYQRQIDWIVDQMEQLLKQVVVQRRFLQGLSEVKRTPDGQVIIPQAAIAQSEVCVFDEVKEIIPMPNFDHLTAQELKNVDDVELSPNVLWQLHDFVTSICTMYRGNPFHNFEHATHVTMSVVKLLSRVVSPTDYANETDEDGEGMLRSGVNKNTHELHDFSYGISSDPLTQFAVVFGALIHDVDHLGVSNAQLVKEGSRLARIYKSQSVAEQNSVNIAWDLLMDPAFESLRRCIYTNESDFDRFRATVVNVVMATDIVDKDLKQMRNQRWEKAFSKTEGGDESTKEDSDRKATIVLEHLIQASDISHTMQHWHVYQKWNHKLYRELYVAYIKGRMSGNPADFWYKGEIGFFDFYIIPLAKKLRDCGVFGVSCDEFLNYACENRAQWEKEGEEVVRKLIESVENDEEIKKLKEKYGFQEKEKEDA